MHSAQRAFRPFNNIGLGQLADDQQRMYCGSHPLPLTVRTISWQCSARAALQTRLELDSMPGV
jgi:hypothetical protein